MALETGEGREEFGLKFQKELNEILDKYANEDQTFYILHMVKTIRHLIYTEFKGTWIKLSQHGFNKIVHETGGRGLVSSICYKAEFPRGKITRMWVLPPDVPTAEGISYEQAYSDEIVKSAGGIPISYG